MARVFAIGQSRTASDDNHGIIESEAEVPLTCEKCQGVGIRAATTKSFEYEGQSLRCLAFVSSCMVCGHHWDDDIHAADNFRQVEQARQVASDRHQEPEDLHENNEL